MTSRSFSSCFAVAAFVCASTALAFHSGGVAECNGCHTMHTSYEGQAPVAPNGVTVTSAGPYLLKGSDQSSACLNCHAGASRYSFRVMTFPLPGAGTPPVQLTPGGDFAWVKKGYAWTQPWGEAAESKADRHGHNVVAADYTLAADATLVTAPGGTYPASQLHCSSCHDPHGKYRRNTAGAISTTGLPIIGSGSHSDSVDPTTWGSVGVYRLLGGAGYRPKSITDTSLAFAWTSPAAIAPPDYNRSEAVTMTRVGYGRNMSQWCSNCHLEMHSVFASNYVHPTDQMLGAEVTANYNRYVKSGTINGSSLTSFNSLVPFQSDNTTNYALLETYAKTDNSNLNGPISGDRVMCLSCHRAHASGWDSMMRWSMGNEFMTVADANGVPLYADPATAPQVAQGRTTDEYRMAMYDRPPEVFAPFQRVYCNKCHIKD